MAHDGNHKYVSVTTALGIVEKPHLTGWKVKHGTKKLKIFLEAFGLSESQVEATINGIPNKVLRECRIERDEFLLTGEDIGAKSRTIGDDFHGRIEAYLEGKNWDKEGSVGLMATEVVNWLTEHKVQAVSIEEQLISENYGYQGTADCIGLIDGALAVFDWKSSNRMDYKWYPVQLSAYARAWEEMKGQEVKEGYILRVGKIKGKQKPKLDVLHVPDVAGYFPKFLQCLELHTYANSYGQYGE